MMKKLLIALAVIFGIVLFMYGSISTLFNKGLGLGMSLTVFFLVVFGGAGLVYLLKEPADEQVNADPEENTEKNDLSD